MGLEDVVGYAYMYLEHASYRLQDCLQTDAHALQLLVRVEQAITIELVAFFEPGIAFSL